MDNSDTENTPPSSYNSSYSSSPISTTTTPTATEYKAPIQQNWKACHERLLINTVDIRPKPDSQSGRIRRRTSSIRTQHLNKDLTPKKEEEQEMMFSMDNLNETSSPEYTKSDSDATNKTEYTSNRDKITTEIQSTEKKAEPHSAQSQESTHSQKLANTWGQQVSKDQSPYNSTMHRNDTDVEVIEGDMFVMDMGDYKDISYKNNKPNCYKLDSLGSGSDTSEYSDNEEPPSSSTMKRSHPITNFR